MNPPLQEAMALCPDCGAMQSRIMVPCWLCGKPLAEEHLILDAEEIEPPNPLAEQFFAAITIILAGLAAMIGVVFLIDSPESSVVYFLVTVPAFAITIIRSSVRISAGKFSWGDTLLTMVLSTVGVFVALVGLGIALLVALFVMCIAGSR